MIQHELYLYKQSDARHALGVATALTSEVVLSENKVTFFTKRALTLFEQVAILQLVDTYANYFNMRKVQ